MISRVAEHCYWMSRYLERAENVARTLEVNDTLLLDFHVPTEQQWKPLLIISGIHDFEHEPTADTVQEFMTWDIENPSSIVSCLAAARENARIIREVISAEMWERMNYYHLWMQSNSARATYENSRGDFYAQIRRINQLLHGISDATMAHGEAWEFFRMGKYLERASQTARIMDVKYHIIMPSVDDIGNPIDNAHWIAILMSCSGYEPFHKTARSTGMDPGMAVAEFLIFDEQFPRSVRHCIEATQKSSAAISDQPLDQPKNDADIAIAELLKWVTTSNIHTVIARGLHESLTHVVDSIHEIGDAIRRTYFDPPLAEGFSRPTPPAPTQTQTQSQH